MALALIVPPIGSFLRDTRRNMRWIISLVAFITIWILASSYLFSRAEADQKLDPLSVIYFTVINTTHRGIW
jgi:uncharacterized membrane protein YqaE (UPF0057 family)